MTYNGHEILNFLNMVMNEQQQQFIDDMGQLLVSWTLPRTLGRVYGYLLLQGAAVGADVIAGDLGLAKSGVSVAVRQLVALGLVRTMSQRGSRRLVHEALFDLEMIFAARDAQMKNLLAQLRRGARVASSATARRRLSEMAEDVDDVTEALREIARRPRSRERAS
jgi:DNA-binding transcriptional regulator GbsR (MarR family)